MILIGLITLFMVVGMVDGLRWGAVLYGVLAAILLGDGKWRWIGAAAISRDSCSSHTTMTTPITTAITEEN